MVENLKRLLAFLLGGAILVSLLLGYWQVVRAPALNMHSANPRIAALEQKMRRGTIFDRNGRIVAVSTQVNQEWQRTFRGPASLAPVVGYISRARGRTGLEAAFDQFLLGQDPRQAFLNFTRSWVGQPAQGSDIYLTLDLDLQAVAEAELAGRRGAVVALEPITGAVLVAASSPGFQPKNLDAVWEKLRVDPNSPLLNRVTQGLYPPGSTFKVVVATGVLAKGLSNQRETYYCPGYIDIGAKRVHCYQAHGEVNLRQALALSCNVAFIQLGLRLGVGGFWQYAQAFGLTGEVPAELAIRTSTLPKREQIDQHALAQMAIGQGQLLVTPIQMALIMATLANDGLVVTPYFVQKVQAPDGAVTYRGQSKAQWQAIPRQVAQNLRAMLEAVVSEGTGSAAWVPGIRVGGKTGTAENPHGAPHAWFVGLAPIADPRIAIAVVVENAGAGGIAAAPIAQKIFAVAAQKQMLNGRGS